MIRSTFFSLVLIFAFLTGCDNDNDNPTNPGTPASATFTVRIENISEAKAFQSSGVFNTPVGETSPAAIGPGMAYEASFNATPGSKLSFATMFVQSNDFFYAPDENGIELFNGSTPVTGDVTSMVKLWDVGSEVNQEPGAGADQAPRQSGPNTGAADADNTVRLAPDTFNNLPAVGDVIKVTLSSTSATGFTLRIENVSTSTTLNSSAGMSAVPLAPGVFVVHTDAAPLFKSGQADYGMGLAALAEDGDPSGLGGNLAMDTGITQIIAPGVFAISTAGNILFTDGAADRGEGLEALAEDGDPSGLAATVAANSVVTMNGVFNTPVGASAPGPVTPGGAYEFTFTAGENDRLSFATMFVQSNDLFFAPAVTGISLFDGSGMAISGDVTAQISLWDAGTEVNEMPGFGLNQAPRQGGANTGADENGVVQMVNDGFTYPAVSDVIQVTVTVQ